MEQPTKEGMIICGFAGIGKSEATKKWLQVVDLESTPFLKDWNTYIRVAQHMAKNGYTVLLSCHKELRQLLLDNEIEFITVMPVGMLESKDIYIKRYKERGNTEQFVKLMEENWFLFNTPLKGEKIYELNSDKYLSDVLVDIISKGK